MPGMFEYVITQELLPQNFPFKLSTELLAAFFPKLHLVFPHAEVHLQLMMRYPPHVKFSEKNGVDVDVPATLKVRVEEGYSLKMSGDGQERHDIYRGLYHRDGSHG